MSIQSFKKTHDDTFKKVVEMICQPVLDDPLRAIESLVILESVIAGVISVVGRAKNLDQSNRIEMLHVVLVGVEERITDPKIADQLL